MATRSQLSSRPQKVATASRSSFLTPERRLFFAAATMFAAPTVYLSLEWYAAQAYIPSYSYISNFTSELGIPYPFESFKDGRMRQSPRANIMNFNFVQNALLYLPGQLALFRLTRDRLSLPLRIARITAALLRSSGLILIAVFPSSPHDHTSATSLGHIVGALMAIAFGNLSNIISGIAAPPNFHPAYRSGTMLLGTFGVVMMLVFGHVVTPATMGLWQRATIYPITVSDYLTAFTLFAELLRITKVVKRT